jgi:DNA-binding PadR family transcriptional regulator
MSVMVRSRRSNPLALAVLVTLFDGPAHPYDIARTLRLRHHDRSMRLNFGSLYAVVASLAERGLVEVVDTHRQGNRPERTVYAVTAAGRGEALDWLSQLLGEPVKEYPQFEAALTLIAALDPDEAVELLAGRLESLEQALAIDIVGLETGRRELGLPRLFLLEAEYELRIRRTEADFVRELLAELRDGSFPQLELWRSIAAGAPMPDSFPTQLPQPPQET